MSEAFVVQIGRDALTTVLLVSAPLLGLGLVVGLAVSILQATTQIQEQTLSFVPKIVAVLVGVVVFGPWMLGVLLDFARGILGNLQTFVR
ncbi:MAG TPA: flagellar biosynthesis protein FliQ [Firmicutes bacterium]|nr:flagellar biosynthesis protein FliQ [Bacillota bacterium]